MCSYRTHGTSKWAPRNSQTTNHSYRVLDVAVQKYRPSERGGLTSPTNPFWLFIWYRHVASCGATPSAIYPTSPLLPLRLVLPSGRHPKDAHGYEVSRGGLPVVLIHPCKESTHPVVGIPHPAHRRSLIHKRLPSGRHLRAQMFDHSAYPCITLTSTVAHLHCWP